MDPISLIVLLLMLVEITLLPCHSDTVCENMSKRKADPTST